jgi:hypothetical protein
MSNALTTEQAAEAADREILATRSPSDPLHQAAFARLAELRRREVNAADAAAKVVATRRYVVSVKAYADSVKAVVRDAAKAKLGPVLPTQRGLARQLLHCREASSMVAAPGLLEPTMRELLEVSQRGLWLINNAEPVDPIVLEELSQAEAAAWAALIQRAKVVAGEV